MIYYVFLSSGVFHHLKEAMGNDDINLEQLIYKIFMEVAKKNGGGIQIKLVVITD